MSLALFALGFAAQAPAAKDFAHATTLQSEAGWRPVSALLADFDGDGAREVACACRSEAKPPRRRIEIWRAVPGSAAFSRAKTLDLTADVVALAAGDVLAGAGDELVLFNAGGAFALAPLAAEARAERLVECEFLWQTPEPAQVYLWSDGLRDLDGDGLVDLVLPEPGGYVLAVQRRPRASGEAWGALSRVRVPEEADADGVWLSATRREGPAVRGRRARGGFELGFEEEQEANQDSFGPSAGILVQVNEQVSSAHFADWDADRDLDLIAQTSHHLHVWLQGPAGAFSSAPALSLELPVDADKSRRLDTSYSSHAVDLDLDRRADCVIFAGDKRSEDVRTQGLFFTQAAVKTGPAPFGAEGRPASVLVFAGFISGPRFRDLDGDGYPELVLRAVRPDLIDQLRSASTQSIEADLYVYRNRRGVLSRNPDISWRRTVPIERFQLTAEFCGDLTGDGLSELLVRDEPGKLRVMLLRAQGAGDKSSWTIFDRPLWELAIHEESDIELVAPIKGEQRPSVLVVEPTQVLLVRIR